MMHIDHTSIKVRDLVEGYKDDTQTGRVSGGVQSMRLRTDMGIRDRGVSNSGYKEEVSRTKGGLTWNTAECIRMMVK